MGTSGPGGGNKPSQVRLVVELKVKLSSLSRGDVSKAQERSVKTRGEAEFIREKEGT